MNRQPQPHDRPPPQAYLHGTPDGGDRSRARDPDSDAPGRDDGGQDPDAPVRDPGQKPPRQDPDRGDPQIDEPDRDRKR